MRRLLAALAVAMTVAGCAPGQAVGIRFPIGRAEEGRADFIAFRCHACHTIEGVELPAPPAATGISVMLGGHTPRIESYGDLVTAIVNPSHRLSRRYDDRDARESPMAGERLNDVLTVQQLVDIVAYLQREYDYIPPPPMPYWSSYPSPHDPFASPTQ